MKDWMIREDNDRMDMHRSEATRTAQGRIDTLSRELAAANRLNAALAEQVRHLGGTPIFCVKEEELFA